MTTPAAELRVKLLSALADGCYHGAESLAAALAIDRHELWGQLNALAALGLGFHAAPGRGYRLDRPLELLDRGRIVQALDAEAQAMLTGLEVLPEVDSTNRHLLDKPGGAPGAGEACVAEYQSAGRGRRGRRWVSPYGCNLYLSLKWPFRDAPPRLGGLGIACAVAVARTLRGIGLVGVGLKWPNDVLWRDKKLGGILLEFVDSGASPRGVIGVGLNTRMPAPAAHAVAQPWTDIETALGTAVSRNALAGAVIGGLLHAVREFEARGLAGFIEEWRRYDIMPGKAAVLRWSTGHVSGIVEGINPQGELILSVDGVARHYAYGEVSLRPAS